MEPEITLLPESIDTRPPLPPIPTLWIVRWQEWVVGDGSAWRPTGWVIRTSMFPHQSAIEATNEAAKCIQRGCRRIQIIKIDGDAIPAPKDTP